MGVNFLNSEMDITLRLLLALFAGLVLGLNRWLHHKPAGIRTHSLVSIGAAMSMILISQIHPGDADAISRVLQGLITGFGFLGAGVIMHENGSNHVNGLTTAASLWACGLLGACFGAGQFLLGALSISLMLIVLLIGGRVELMAGKVLGIQRESEVPPKQNVGE